MKTIKIMEVTNMEKIFRRTKQGATLGGIIGTAIGVLTTAGAVVATGPVGVSAIVALAVGSAAGSASAGAIGTLVGGGVGAATGTAETVHDHKKRKHQKKNAERRDAQDA